MKKKVKGKKTNLSVLGIDPGIRHTGWCLLSSDGTVVGQGTHTEKIIGKSTWENLYNQFAFMKASLFILNPDCVAIEDYHFMGTKRRGMDKMYKLIGGFVALSRLNWKTVLVTPKKKGKKQKPMENWTQHEMDAYNIAKTVQKELQDAT